MAKKKVTKKKTRSTASGTSKKRPAKKRVTTKKTARKQPARAKSTAPAKKKSAVGKNKVTKKKVVAKKSTAHSTKKTPTKTPTTSAATPEVKKKSPAKRPTTSKVVGRKRSGSVAEAASAASADAQGYVFINGRRVRMISVKKKVEAPAKRARKAVTDNVPVEPELIPSEADKPIKTRLSPKTLDEYRDLLLIKRAELVGDLSAMEAAALQSGGGNLSKLPIHMADVGTDTYDQDFMLGLAEKERSRLREIDDALRRIEDRTYGVCQMTGKPIPKARLLAKPWAKYTIEAAREVEGSWGS